MNITPEFNVERLSAPGTLTDRVFDALVRLMGEGDFPAGARLPSEMTMANQFGVSRTVIREALSRLKSEGMIESRQGSGVFVRARNADSPFRLKADAMDSPRSVQQVIELRHALEGEIAALAAERRTKSQMTAIRQALRQIDADVKSGGDGVDADIQFHHRIAEATCNPHFLALIDFLTKILRTATQTLRNYEATQAALAEQVRNEHAAIVEALEKQNQEAARRAARRHMEGASERLGSAEKKTPERKTSAPTRRRTSTNTR